MSRNLPSRPNLEFLKKEAKDLLVDLRRTDASSQLSNAQFARELLEAWDRGQLIESIARTRHLDWDVAYGIAAEIVELRRARGERPAGRKIGFTEPFLAKIATISTSRC